MRLAGRHLLWITLIWLEYLHLSKATFRVDSCAVTSECVFGAEEGVGCLPAAVGRSLRTDWVNTERLCFHRWLPLLRGSTEPDLGLVQLIF